MGQSTLPHCFHDNIHQQTEELVKGADLQEAADVDFVVGIHEDHILKEPEEGPGVFFAGLQKLQNPVVLKEEPTSALYRTDLFITTPKRQRRPPTKRVGSKTLVPNDPKGCCDLG